MAKYDHGGNMIKRIYSRPTLVKSSATLQSATANIVSVL